MSNWTQEATKSAFDAQSVTNNFIQGRQRGTVSGSYQLNFSGSEYSMVGIKGGMVDQMRGAIATYVNEIQTVLNTVLNYDRIYTEMNKAFRGEEAQKEVSNYINNVKMYCNNLISTLLAFSDKLADVGNAWKTAQSNIAGTINASSANLNEGTVYTEQQTYNG